MLLRVNEKMKNHIMRAISDGKGKKVRGSCMCLEKRRDKKASRLPPAESG